MNAFSALILTAAATVGTVRAVRSLRRTLRGRQERPRQHDIRQKTADEPLIVDFERDSGTGVYRAKK